MVDTTTCIRRGHSAGVDVRGAVQLRQLCAAQEVFLTSHYLGIAMEYADGGDLSQYIDGQTARGIWGLPEAQARWLFQQLIVAVEYCHRLGIANRDIKVIQSPSEPNMFVEL